TLERTDALVLECTAALSRAAGLAAEDMVARLLSLGFAAFVPLHAGSTVRASLDDLRNLSGGSIDFIFVHERRLNDFARAIDEHPRGAMTIIEFADRNKRVMRPI